MLRVGVDTGGTFTDFACTAPSGEAVHIKVASTPDDPARAIITGLRQLHHRLQVSAATPTHLVHGTTVATNAVLERRGARVGFISNQGFGDLLFLGRQARPDLYALVPLAQPPLVDAADCFTVRVRRDHRGQALLPFGKDEADAFVRENQEALADCDAFAILFLHDYIDGGADEKCLAGSLQRQFPGAAITSASQLVPLSREYERASTAVVNAFVQPVMSSYLSRLCDAVHENTRIDVMGSAGGVVTVQAATAHPVHTVLSGPAGGIRGAAHAAQRNGFEGLLAFDMGGTSTDVAVVRGDLAPEPDGHIGPHPLRIPLLPIETIGAGGGSIAAIDSGGALRVGPQSAGSSPGPACYGRGGTHPTVSDANAVLGRLSTLLGGELDLDIAAARQVMEPIARRLDLSIEQTALAIVEVTEATMVRACKRVTMERGHDPRLLTLVAFGGAAGLHACALAQAIGAPRVLFPRGSGVLSAAGMLSAPMEVTLSRSLSCTFAQPQQAKTEQGGAATEEFYRTVVSTLEQARAECAAQTEDSNAMARAQWRGYLDCRHHGQTFTLNVLFSGVLAAADQTNELLAQVPSVEWFCREFIALHKERYGYALDGDVEFVALRIIVSLAVEELDRTLSSEKEAATHTGPRIFSTYDSTLWLPSGWQATSGETGDWLCTPIPQDQYTAEAQGGATAADLHALPARSAPQGGSDPAVGLAIEIHRQQLAAIAEEMGAALMRSAFSANIKERRDFSCAIFDERGELLAHAAHIPVHLGAQAIAVQAVISTFAENPLQRDEQAILNDPYSGGTHLPDITVVAAVYPSSAGAESQKGSRPLFYVANRAHHADIGGKTAGSMPAPVDAQGRPSPTTIADEGWRCDVKRLTDEVITSLCNASRTPEQRRGDILAQTAANLCGRRGLEALMQTRAADRLHQLNHLLLDYSERRMRAAIEELPDGDYPFTDFLDDDGLGQRNVALRVVMSIRGAEATLDFSTSDPAVDSSLNAVPAIVVSAVAYVFRCLAAHLGGAAAAEGNRIPANAGLMRPLRVVTTPGTVCHAVFPYGVAAGNVETSQRLVDTILGALSGAIPQIIPAASAGTMSNVLFGGDHDGKPFVHYETLAGGSGASFSAPGCDAIQTHMTNTLNTPIEELERLFPVRIEEYALRPPYRSPDPSQVIRYTGGRGIRRCYRFLVATELTLIGERHRRGPWSLGGAPEGVRGQHTLQRANGEKSTLAGKAVVHLGPGDLLIVETPGGGHVG